MAKIYFKISHFFFQKLPLPNKAMDERCCLESESLKLVGKANVVGNSSLKKINIFEKKLHKFLFPTKKSYFVVE